MPDSSKKRSITSTLQGPISPYCAKSIKLAIVLLAKDIVIMKLKSVEVPPTRI